MVSSGHGFRVCVKTSVFRQGTNLVVPLERGHRAVSTAEGTTSGAKAPHMPHVIGTVKTVPLHTPEEVLKRLLYHFSHWYRLSNRRVQGVVATACPLCRGFVPGKAHGTPKRAVATSGYTFPKND